VNKNVWGKYELWANCFGTIQILILEAIVVKDVSPNCIAVDVPVIFVSRNGQNKIKKRLK